ncbi:4-hydroxy-tetrahydrodipicolinate synthase [Lutibacter profundi]|uniref:4-hydroxy-tetrahydrodipicolinate synthase n=1 Tax=Lutibacter profundi TaxID=1622118 RepID=A0A109RMM4_9FLAO|nr:4-hydroxy-tetrahydrodipicolinate synthase [Lutibacter profundi]AMC09774.1 4-hydroxy-tetrahydrodipicolinate synthase [Lutibacter profundi]
MKELVGTGVALVTPFNQDKSVDFEGLKRLVNYQIDNGINYLVLLGTTGEPATLTLKEIEQIKNTVVKTTNGRVPLVLGIGGNNTNAVVEEIKATDLSDYCAILSVSPYYNKPTQEGIYQHFKAIAAVSSKPIILYNVPSRTGVNVEPKTVIRIANDFKNIVAIKEAAGDIIQVLRLVQTKPTNFMVISGDDMIALPMVLVGGSGVISVIGQGLPKDFSEMIQHGLKGNVAKANALHYKVMESIDSIFEEGNPAGIKALLKKLNICSEDVRLPLVNASYDLQQKINTFVDNY